jgi:hypothetical protein
MGRWERVGRSTSQKTLPANEHASEGRVAGSSFGEKPHFPKGEWGFKIFTYERVTLDG